MTTNINNNEYILQRPRNKYLSKSSFLNVNNRIKRYDGDNLVKNLIEIQKDEIRRIIRDDPKQFEFLQVFVNPLISGTGINKKGQIKSFDLRNKVKFKILSFSPLVISKCAVKLIIPVYKIVYCSIVVVIRYINRLCKRVTN